MAKKQVSAAERLTNTGRIGSSRKLLQRKVLVKAATAPLKHVLEVSFPAPALQEPEAPQKPQGGSSRGPAAAQASVPTPPPVWSSEDEAALQILLTRRKAAGYQRRGRDVSAQKLRPGDIKPNAGTVAATIVGIVAELGELGRAELLDFMANTDFSHSKAQPQDKAWCQGYVAGAIRSGFLVVVAEASATAGEGSIAAGEGSAPVDESSATPGEWS